MPGSQEIRLIKPPAMAWIRSIFWFGQRILIGFSRARRASIGMPGRRFLWQRPGCTVVAAQVYERVEHFAAAAAAHLTLGLPELLTG